MGSPSMDRFGGNTQADLDLRRGDLFALTNFQSKVLDWNVNGEHWRAGYTERLHEALIDPSKAHGVDPFDIEDALTRPTTRRTNAA